MLKKNLCLNLCIRWEVGNDQTDNSRLNPFADSLDREPHRRRICAWQGYDQHLRGLFSLLKRGLVGTYHHVSEHHLQRYVSQFDFRYNNREKLEIDDEQRAVNALKSISGKRLTYRRLDA